MSRLSKSEKIQFTFIFLLGVSYFIPWFSSESENFSLFKDARLFLEFQFKEHYFPFIPSGIYGMWETFSLNLFFIFNLCSFLLPVLAGITVYRIYKNRNYILFKKLLIRLQS